jgi:hypothetical protein
MAINQVNTIFGDFQEDDLKIIRDSIEEMSKHMTKIDLEKQAIKDVVNSIYDQYSLPKKILNRMAKVYHKQIFSQQVVEDKEFEALYTGVTEIK